MKNRFATAMIALSMLASANANAFTLNEIPTVIVDVEYEGIVSIIRHSKTGMFEVFASAAGYQDSTFYTIQGHDVGTPGFITMLARVNQVANDMCYGNGAFEPLSFGDVGFFTLNYQAVGGPIENVTCH